MIPLEKESHILELLAKQTLSQRKIAYIVGVSRGTVSCIANGKIRHRSSNISADEAIDSGLSVPPSGSYVRCPGCGGMVQMPCLLCYFQKNGIGYPKEVLEAYRHPKPVPLTKRCSSCEKDKLVASFEQSDSAVNGVTMIRSICFECRRQHNINLNYNKGHSSLNDKRKVRDW